MAPTTESTTPIESPISIDHEEVEASIQISVAPEAASEMEPFEDYKPKIQKLLQDLKFPECSIESLQHGYQFQNCVYAITSLTEPTERYIIRVPACFDKECDERCSEIEDGVCVLNHLRDKLPVPETKTFSATPDNSLERPYAIQTRLEGQSLNHVYSSLDDAERRRMIDEYIDLVVKLESIKLPNAGSLVAPKPLPTNLENSSNIPAPSIRIFDGYDTDPIEDPTILTDRAGSDIKRLFESLIAKYIASDLQSIADGYNGFRLPYWRRMQTMLDQMHQESFFRPEPEPIVMHHWDLEARNIMVSQTPDGEWKITGVIDWDEAICLPRPLARKPPAWFWTSTDNDEDTSSGESDCDLYPDRELSDKQAELKAYFDARVEELLPGYGEDAYGSGRLLRRLWALIQDGLSRQWTIEPYEQLLAEWERRSRDRDVPLSSETKTKEHVADEPIPIENENAADEPPGTDHSSFEQPQPENPEPNQPDAKLSQALQRGWKKALAWVSVRL